MYINYLLRGGNKYLAPLFLSMLFWHENGAESLRACLLRYSLSAVISPSVHGSVAGVLPVRLFVFSVLTVIGDSDLARNPRSYGIRNLSVFFFVSPPLSGGNKGILINGDPPPLIPWVFPPFQLVQG